MSIWIIIAIIGGITSGAAGGIIWRNSTLSRQQRRYQEHIDHIDDIKHSIVTQAKEEAKHIIDRAEQKEKKIEQKGEETEQRLLRREERFDKQLLALNEEKDELRTKEKAIDDLYNEQKKILTELTNMSPDDARDVLFARIEKTYADDIEHTKQKYINTLRSDIHTQATHIIAQALPRVSTESVSEYTTTTIDIPNEDFKGKLIGREGRNINYFEKTTGVELVIDDTPLVVKVSSFDHEKRFVAANTLTKLISDARVNPFYIEKRYLEMQNNIDDILMDKGKDALTALGLGLMKPDIMHMIGKFHLRYSYGQNLLIHSTEVAKISAAIASEMGLDTTLAKKAGLLHDIGKVIAKTDESHTKLGAEFLERHGVNDVIVNAAASHHFEVEMISPISRIIAAADAISGSRPGARFNSKERFIEKMTELEKLVYTVTGVRKVHIMQAGREIMVYFNPDIIRDRDIRPTIETIGKTIEDHLDYPGIIRIVAMREQRVIEYLR